MIRLRRIVLFVLGITPFLYIGQAIVRLQSGEWEILGPEPGKAVVWFTGTWAFNFLLLTLAVTPLRRLLKQPWLIQHRLIQHRRMLGLFAFFYASLHLLSYFAFLLEWRFAELGAETIKRPYLLLGMTAWLLLLPLAVTSTRGWQRRLKQGWKRLHKLIYPLSVLVAVHYLLQIRSSWFEPVLYAALVLCLLLLRWQKATVAKHPDGHNS
ncbi:sulfite oxidase heme-binding subunit YedZ [Thalassolituus pacificus]|uniref:Protein-methionine-sulfoxide reductase heme-binding subunit MsrQ n=1 Tax=Thalassolituus pacificus TaxID=2975440 RepID=A0A9X3AQ16_9GAMM|nr:protein-methionine-sulfoxide reductase heme-binding subunit MsrQ [Thalassolituus pacificus]MCT7357770.1 sulfoxide reductase heme-binding subunit YedZ [Thalassolituus pacificus]